MKKDYKYFSIMFEGIYTYGCEKCRRTVAVSKDEQLNKVYCDKYKPKEI